MSQILDGQLSHDKIATFLRSSKSSSKKLWEHVKPSIRKMKESTAGVLILDDSIEEKPYTILKSKVV